jgi:hypothetical protein
VSSRGLLLALGVAIGLVSSCSLIYRLDGFDQSGTGGAAAGAGGDAAGTPDAGDDAPAEADAGSADAPAEGDAGPCDGKADGTVCSPAKDVCHAASTCSGGACVAGNALPDGTAFDASNHTACCGGAVTSLTTSQNCNVCGISCPSPLKCEAQGQNPTIYQCVGCMIYGTSGCLEKNCCVTTLVADGVCAASDCNGGCVSNCPNGSHCVNENFAGSGKDDYCSY